MRFLIGIWLVVFAGLFLTAAPVAAHIVFERWLGGAILANRAIPTHLGMETFTAVGAPYVAAGWLGYVLVAWSDKNVPGLSIGTQAICALATLSLIGLRAKRTSEAAGGALAAGIAIVIASFLFAESARPAGELSAWCFAAMLAIVPVRERPIVTAACVCAGSALWANVSAFGIVAPLVVLLIQLADGATLRRSFGLALVSSVSVLANPQGALLFAHAAGTLELDRSLMLLRPELPSYMYSSTYRFGLPVLIAAAAYAAQIRRKSFGEALSILVSIAAILFSGEFLPFSAIVMVPIVARDIAPTLRAISLPTRWKTYVSIFAFASLAMLLCIEYRDADTRVSAANDGVTVARQLAEVPGPHRIWCLDRDGELCDAFLPYAPRIRVFADERVAAYPFAVRAEAFALREPGGFRWLERLKSDRIDSVVVPADNILMRVADGRGWRKVGSAGDFAALVRT